MAVQHQNAMAGTDFGTFAASYAEGGIYNCHKVNHFDGFCGANAHTFAATYASHLTLFHCQGTFVVVAAGHKALFLALRHELHQRPRTSIHTPAATHTVVIIHLWQPGFGIHAQGIIRTGLHTVAAAQTAVCTFRVAAAGQGFQRTAAHAVVERSMRPQRTRAVTCRNCHFGLYLRRGHTHNCQ